MIESSAKVAIQVVIRAVESKDPYTAGHSERVAAYALQIGRRMMLSQSDLEILEFGCLVHDVGKIGVPDQILGKPSSLTKEEFEIVRRHPVEGLRILESLPLPDGCLEIVRSHHERLNGSGYPDGLKGDQIPLLVRIAMVADAFDAMTSHRAYRKSMSKLQALEELKKDAATGYLDTRVVEILADIVNEPSIDSNERENLIPRSPRRAKKRTQVAA